jgi:hypothetical protein
MIRTAVYTAVIVLAFAAFVCLCMWLRCREQAQAAAAARHPSARPWNVTAAMTGPKPRDGDPLEPFEAIALAALIYSIRNEEAPEPVYPRSGERGQR